MATSTLTRETNLVQNPALGGVLLWRFCVAYAAEHRTHEGPPLQLTFLVLPMTFHRGTFEELSGTRGSIHLFAEKFARSDTSKSDMLLGIQSRAVEFRELTMESVSLALKARLVTLVSSTGRLVALSSSKSSTFPQSVRQLATGAERLGKWFAVMSLFEIENILKVAF
jgi:Family of unknown function (DUF6521)